MFFVDLLVGIPRICSVISIQAFRCFPQNGFLPLLPLTLPSLPPSASGVVVPRRRRGRRARVIEKTGYSTSFLLFSSPYLWAHRAHNCIVLVALNSPNNIKTIRLDVSFSDCTVNHFPVVLKKFAKCVSKCALFLGSFFFLGSEYDRG